GPDGVRRLRFDDDEPSLDSARTMAPGLSGGAKGAPILGRIDQYDLLEKLGGGGFGVVYKALDTVSGVEVALKTLHPLLKSNQEEMETLRAKFALVSRLSHPNIASALVLHPCRDIAIADDAAGRELRLVPGDFVMVMRYAPGVTLSRWRRQFPGGAVPPDRALEVARQIAAALDYAHGERIVHRDIKPANVMVETLSSKESPPSTKDEGRRTKEEEAASSPGEQPLQTSKLPNLETSRIRIRILDFGLAAEIRSSMSRVSNEAGDTSGTRPYMAPEQWLGRKQDGRTDQYALACVLYELLSGAPPFAGVFETGDPIIMRTAVEHDAPEEIEGVSPQLNAALQKALAKNPKERFASCAAFVESCGRDDLRVGRDADAGGPPASRQAPSAVSETERKEREEAERKAREENERKEREETARRTREALERKAREEAERQAMYEAGRRAWEEATSKGREAEEARRAREADAARPVGAMPTPRPSKGANPLLVFFAAMLAVAAFFGYGYWQQRQENERQQAAARAVRRDEFERRARLEAERKSRKTGEAASPAAWNGGARAGEQKTVRVGSQTVNLRWCPPGSFTMGSPTSEDGRDSDETQHRVTLTRGFWMGETEVTQGLWREVMGDNPSYFKNGDNYPVENVSWEDCKKFVDKLNSRYAQSGLRWAMPTEAQWEYACRAGSMTAYFWGNALNGDRANCDGNHPCGTTQKGPYKQKTTPARSYRPNAWGLYDMH
ncbi:MAG: SUMF1/EgtB/PvdO family nonheme iron enzyme, partial [Kiritimatiellae bacterium]|nr:SUMF1/EgtB/PvdO family nonheme iron enzyme [Kiritimatiellia bacterium]